MQNRTDIINAALQRCGAAGINLGYQDTQEAAIAMAAYDRVRKYVLGQYPWGFAQVYATLPQNVNAQPFGYRYEFTLPADCAQIVDVHTYCQAEDGAPAPAHLFGERLAKWEVVGRSIVSNAHTVALRYVSDDIRDMPAFFGDVVAWRLAFEIAPYLQQGTNQAAVFLQMYQQSLDDARVENDRQMNPETVPDWKESRHLYAQFRGAEERW